MSIRLAILGVWLVSCLHAASSGVVSVCDVDANWGCNSWQFGDRLKCNDPNKGFMPWATKPTFEPKYSLRSGNFAPASDTTKYTPGELTEIWIRTLDYKYKWRGILIHAIDENKKVVGTWEIPPMPNPLFHTPCGGNNKGALLHVNADPKPLSVLLKWRAPAAGTGTVTFKCLLKRGPANTGHFHFPNAKELTLTEGTAPVQTEGTLEWFMAPLNTDCQTHCASLGKSCKEDELTKVSNQYSFETMVGKHQACRRPVFSSCGSFSPSFSSSNSLCYFHEQTGCTTPTTATCASKASNQQRYCPCAVGPPTAPTSPTAKPPSPAAPTPRPPSLPPVGAPTAPTTRRPTLPPNSAVPPTSDGNVVSAAQPAHSPASLFVLASLLGPNGGKNVLLASILALLQYTSAHNWLGTHARANKLASTTAPCLARSPGETHAQVGKNQPFPFRFATGHGSQARDNYIFVIKGEDYHQLSRSDLQQVAQEYIAEAPAGSNLALQPAFRRYHDTGGNTASIGDGGGVYKTPPLSYSPIPFREKTSTFDYLDSAISGDHRYSYASTKHPWLEAVHVYKQLNDFASDYDALNITIPARKGAGHYIVHWRWNGYYDCMDVDVRDSPVQNVYGTKKTDTFTWNRVDHCAYVDYIDMTSQCVPAVTGLADCLKQTSSVWKGSWKSSRFGMMLVPFENPATVAFPDLVNIPTNQGKCVGGSEIFHATGPITQTPIDWTSWKSSTVITAGQECRTPFLDSMKTTLRNAVALCSPKNCSGIVWDSGVDPTASPEAIRSFWFCTNDGFVAAAGKTIGAKKSIPDPTPALGPVIRVAMGKGSKPPGLPSTYVGAPGYMLDAGLPFGTTGTLDGIQYKYGWNCENPYGRSGFNNGATTVNKSSVNPATSEGCGGRFNYSAGARNFWEIEVPNGVYDVNLYFNGNSDMKPYARSVEDCAVENVAVFVRKQFGVTSFADWTTATRVEVMDGRLTVSAEHSMVALPQMSSNIAGKCKDLSTVTLQKVQEALPPVWLPATANPWWQMEVDRRAIGLVLFKGMYSMNHCSARFLFRGNKCIQNTDGIPSVPMESFEGPDEGVIVGVSDVPCTGSTCSGTICGKLRFAQYGSRGYPFRYNSNLQVDCKGAVGKYVWVQLPGDKRILNVPNITVTYRTPPVAKQGPAKMACFMVQPRTRTPVTPEYITTNDPEDPVYYSTCYRREASVTWDFPPAVDPPPAPSLIANMHCLTCDSFKKNQNTSSFFVPEWTIADKCLECP